MRLSLHGKRVTRIGSWGHPCVVCRDGTTAAGRLKIEVREEERLVDLCDGHLCELTLHVRAVRAGLL